MSPSAIRTVRGMDGFPRVSGDEPEGKPSLVGEAEFSPRERG